jgi:hypothetical protein
MKCQTCGNAAHIEFPTGSSRCDGCDKRPVFCRCSPVVASVPEWIRRRQAGQLPAKDMTRAA